MNPLMMVVMLLVGGGGHSMMNGRGNHHAKVPTAVIDVRYQVCPVKGDKPLPEIAALRRTRVYHFCSRECLESFKKNPRSVLQRIKNPQEFALRTTNPDGIDPVSKHPINARKSPPFLVRGSTITFYATFDTVGRDSEISGFTPNPGVTASGSHSGDHDGHSMMCH